jgi:hypothetical protein
MVLAVPMHLYCLLVVISFHWDRSKLSLFRTALHEIIQYRTRTNVDIVVVTDNANSLANALRYFRYKNVDIHEFNASSKHNTGNKYDLLWEHRLVIDERWESVRNYSSFMYIEDDTLVPWTNLVSWAIDTEVLEPLGFTRGVYRTEINAAGQLSMNDMVVDLANFLGCSMNITKDAQNKHFVQTVDVTSGDAAENYNNVVATYGHQYCLPAELTTTWARRRRLTSIVDLTSNASTASNSQHNKARDHGLISTRSHKAVHCPVHNHFVQLYSPFEGLWIFSRSQLAIIRQDPLWDRSISMKKETRRNGQANWNWGVPERSNSILYFVRPPKGFLTSNVVPFTFLDHNISTPRLSPYASVEHIRHGYDIICTVENALVA